MKVKPWRHIAILIASTAVSFIASAHEAPQHDHAAIVPIPAYNYGTSQSSADTAYHAVTDLIESLTQEQKTSALFAYIADERANWSNLPVGMVPRDGLSIGELSESQRDKLFEFLSASLGETGYHRVAEILAAEAYLSSSYRAPRMGWFPENYTFAIFGTPSKTSPWAWQFGGHHLGLNVSIENNRIESMSPTHLGTEPVIFTFDGVDYSVLTDMHDAGLELFNTLTPAQKSDAMGIRIPREIVTGPRKDGFIPEKVGISGSEMSAAQKDLLLTLIAKWVEVQPHENASHRMVEITSDLTETSFAWAGSENPTDSGYFRVQGPSVIIEHLSFGARRRVGTSTDGHYHTMYRNPLNDYGEND